MVQLVNDGVVSRAVIPCRHAQARSGKWVTMSILAASRSETITYLDPPQKNDKLILPLNGTVEECKMKYLFRDKLN